MTEIYGYIYKIENLINGKVYIGQTIQDPKKREQAHLRDLRRKKHRNIHLQNSFNKHGESNFKFTVLNYATAKEVIDRLEDDYIQYYGCLNNSKGYNLMSGGSHGSPSIETRKKMSEAHKGKKLSDETKYKVSKNNARHWLGKKRPLETCKKFSEAHKDKPLSLEHRANMSISQRGRGIFGFTGVILKKDRNFEKKAWCSHIYFKSHHKILGHFHDPLSCQLVHDLVFNEIYI